ncbi:hypothetical protein WOLCODRAFT_158009 [Wolfiporia cocos MD-104 SS10]|uniref:Uncharacterized protein n=1 Tax=Wolfiporia cocos (strain MD-104) TaxID=742152 RepID=A0A2H3JEX7_WOLCO|nr:hypothetical protein WOLCODRAFT_158009 [Wolfiporia cocos MD-104 SS10]
MLAGPDAIEVHLAELVSKGQRDRRLVESLEVLLAKARKNKKVKSVVFDVPRATLDTMTSAAKCNKSSSADKQGPAGASPKSTLTDGEDATEERAEMPVSMAPLLPKLFAGSQITEVSVETQDKGSSNDRSDGSDEESDENDQESDNNDKESDNHDDTILKNIDPKTLLHGPYSQKSILNQLLSSDSSNHSTDKHDGSDRYEQASSTDDGSDATVEDNEQTYMDADPQDAVEQQDVNLSIAAMLAYSDEQAELEGSATRVVALVPDDQASDETGEDGVMPSSQPSKEHKTSAQTDPIETAEDPDPAAQNTVDDDPIQDVDGFVTPLNEHQLNPPVKTPKSGMIKDRHGRLPKADIQLAAAAQSTPAPMADNEAERHMTWMTTC